MGGSRKVGCGTWVSPERDDLIDLFGSFSPKKQATLSGRSQISEKACGLPMRDATSHQKFHESIDSSLVMNDLPSTRSGCGMGLVALAGSNSFLFAAESYLRL